MPKRKAKSMKSTGTKEWRGAGPRESVLQGPWLALAEQYGGVYALATAVGVSYTTLYRWAVKGDPVPGPARIVLGVLASQKGLANPAIPTL